MHDKRGYTAGAVGSWADRPWPAALSSYHAGSVNMCRFNQAEKSRTALMIKPASCGFGTYQP